MFYKRQKPVRPMILVIHEVCSFFVTVQRYSQTLNDKKRVKTRHFQTKERLLGFLLKAAHLFSTLCFSNTRFVFS